MKKILILVMVLSLIFGTTLMGCQQDAPEQGGGGELSFGFEFEPMTIRFFAGGEAGDAFASIVYRGAMDAAEMLAPYGVTVEYVFSGWSTEQMVSQLREAIASGVDAICMMGHPGDDAILPLALEAREAGIIMMYQNVNVPEVRAQLGGGYVGVVDLGDQGRALARAAINEFTIQPGDRVLVFGGWGQPGRYLREEGSALEFEEAGFIVDRLEAPPEAAADPQLMLPVLSAQIASHPETVLVLFPGGQQLSVAGMYMDALGKAPGEIYMIGFDLNEGVLEAFENGYVQLTADQQPYLQGFLPILNAFLTFHFELGYLEIETGAGLVDVTNFGDVRELVEEGIR